MRIALVGSGLIDVPPPGYGAIERRIWHLAQELKGLGHEAHIVSHVFSPTRAGAYRFALWARREARRMAPDVIQIETASVANVFGTLGPRPYVYATNSSHWTGTRSLVESIELAVEKRACELAAATIAVSEVQRRAMPRLRRLEVIPNGVDTGAFVPRPEARDGRTVLGVGVVAPRKRWHVAARAIAGLPARLRIVGPVADAAYARRIAALAPGQVELAGAADGARCQAEAGAADVLVHPADREGFALVVVEGMSAGLPVIGTRLQKEAIDDGVQGYLLDDADGEDALVAAMRERIVRLLSDDALRQRMSRAARRRAVEEFSWRRVAQRLVGLYERLDDEGALDAPMRHVRRGSRARGS